MIRLCAMGMGLGLLLTGCGAIEVSDGGEGLLGEGLHQPYARGATVHVRFRATLPTPWGGLANPWRATVDDEDVAALVQQTSTFDADGNRDGLEVVLAMTSEGSTTLRLFEGDATAESWSGTVEVVVPDQLELVPAIDAQVFGRDQAPAERGEEVLALQGHDAAFMVRLRKGGRSVYGTGSVEARVDGEGLYAEPDTSVLGRDREWFKLRASGAGPVSVHFLSDGTELHDVAVRGVEAAAVQTLTLDASSESGLSDGASATAILRGHGDGGRPVYGLVGTFRFDDNTLQGEGDHVVYEFMADEEVELFARAGDVEVRRTVHGRGARVGNTNQVSCVQAPLSLWGLAALVFAVRRRRRAA